MNDAGLTLEGAVRDGVRGSFRQADPALKEIRERILAASSQSQQLRIEGMGTKSFYGEVVTQTEKLASLQVTAYRGIVSYEPTELVITAKCGTPISEIEAALKERNQMLAFEPPRFLIATNTGTIGGAIATGLSGPRRVSAGAAKDFVLGAALVDSAGQWLQFGGTVMKNVAGYDLARLLCGSLGIFGVVAEVSLKVLPVSAAERSLFVTATQEQALHWLNEWGGQPLPIIASQWHNGKLCLRLAGAQAAVDSAVAKLSNQFGASQIDTASASALWNALRDQSAGFFINTLARQAGKRLWRLSLPSTAPVVKLDGEQMIEWGGALRWIWSGSSVDEVRREAQAMGGTAMLYRGEFTQEERIKSADLSRMHPLSPTLMKVHQRLKAQLDPKGLFNPSKMYPGL